MDTKLTLKLDKQIIARAKRYAEKRNQSLSELVEQFFRRITEPEGDAAPPYSPLVRELSGVLSAKQTRDLEKEYTAYLIEKYR